MTRVTPVPVVAGLPLDGRYRLDDRVGAGGTGEVWRATDLALNRRVAVKLLRPGYAGHGKSLARLRATARHAASVSHPGIIRVYDYCETGSQSPPYLVMELVDGPSLAALLARGPLEPVRAMDLVAQAARALQATHAAGLVHGDLTPASLLVSRSSGQLKIIDFGMAGANGAPAADLYALGDVAFQCLTGRGTLAREPPAVPPAQPDRALPPLPASVPAPIAALVADLTARDPAARPGSAAEIARRAERLGPPARRLELPRQTGPLGPTRPVRVSSPAPAPAPALLRPGQHTGRPGRRRDTRSGRHSRRPVLAAAIGVGAVAASGWLLAGLHGSGPAHSRPGPAAVSAQSGHHPGHPAASTPSRTPDGAGGEAARKPSRGYQPAAAPTPVAATTPPAGPATPRSAPASTSAGIPTASGTAVSGSPPASTGTGTPGGTSTPTGAPTSGSAPPSGSSPASGAPTSTDPSGPSGTAVPSGTSTAASPTGPGTGTGTGTDAPSPSGR
jgi:serine/threonine-protein kinase